MRLQLRRSNDRPVYGRRRDENRCHVSRYVAFRSYISFQSCVGLHCPKTVTRRNTIQPSDPVVRRIDDAVFNPNRQRTYRGY